MVGCLGSILRFMFFVICTLVVIWYGGLSIISFFSSLFFGQSWIDFCQVLGIWAGANYLIGWLIDVWLKEDSVVEGFFANFVVITSELIYHGINKMVKKIIPGL